MMREKEGVGGGREDWEEGGDKVVSCPDSTVSQGRTV